MAGQFIIARNKTWRNTMKTTAFNSPKTRKTKIGEGVYIPPLNSPLLVELMRSSLVRRRVKLCEVKGERERKKKEKVYQMEKSRFHHHRSLRSFPRRGYSSLNVLTVLRHTFNTILLYLATLLSDITDIKCHAISF